MRLTIISGEAMKRAMKQIGINIGWINYQENGNWKPHLLQSKKCDYAKKT